MAGALRALPYTATRETVASWLSTGDAKRRSLAAYVLAKRAIAEDTDQLVAELDAEVDAGVEGDQYVICSLAEALSRNPEHGPYGELRRALNEMPYSYGRHFVVDAIAASDPAFSSDLAIDCLWDAEPMVRAVGAGHASRTDPASIGRLDEIRADDNEEPAVRSAAA